MTDATQIALIGGGFGLAIAAVNGLVLLRVSKAAEAAKESAKVTKEIAADAKQIVISVDGRLDRMFQFAEDANYRKGKLDEQAEVRERHEHEDAHGAGAQGPGAP